MTSGPEGLQLVAHEVDVQTLHLGHAEVWAQSHLQPHKVRPWEGLQEALSGQGDRNHLGTLDA